MERTGRRLWYERGVIAPSRMFVPGVTLSLLLLSACGGSGDARTTPDTGVALGAGTPVELPMTVDFDSVGAGDVRASACAQTFENPARIGAGAELLTAPNLWSVSPYLVLIPASGEGYVSLNIDALHFDWLLYTTSDVTIEGLDGPLLESGGTVAQCPGQDLVEYGGHHHEIIDWPLRLRGEPGSRAKFFAALSGTEHSDPDAAGHAGHNLSGDPDAGVDDQP